MAQRCVHCRGNGCVSRDDPIQEGSFVSVCPVCHGSGFIVADCSGDSCSMPHTDEQEGE